MIAPASRRAEFGGRLDLAALEALPLILPGFPHSLRHLVDALAANERLRLDIVAEVDSTYAIKRLVADGLGCSILSGHAVRDEILSGELAAVPINCAGLGRNVQLGTNLDRTDDPAVRSIARLTGEVFTRHWEQ